VASYPGSLTHIDFKTFGFLRGAPGVEGVRLGGFVVVDSLTSHASVYLAKVADAIEAVAALRAYIEKAPFPVKGIVLSDNGGPFLSDHWLNFCQANKLIPRRIRSSHPWSNGKVEALNKTLKYECFAALAGNICKWEDALNLVEVWLSFYNSTRAHTGHCNQGLPPDVFFSLYQKTPGDHLEKLDFFPDLRESVLPPVEPGKANPRLLLAK